jgi:hypothetical protein
MREKQSNTDEIDIKYKLSLFNNKHKSDEGILFKVIKNDRKIKKLKVSLLKAK